MTSRSSSLLVSFMLFKNRFFFVTFSGSSAPSLHPPVKCWCSFPVLYWFPLHSQSPLSPGVVIDSTTSHITSAVQSNFPPSLPSRFFTENSHSSFGSPFKSPLLWGAFVDTSLCHQTDVGAPYLVLPKYCNDLFPCLAPTLRVGASSQISSLTDSPQEASPLPWGPQKMETLSEISLYPWHSHGT